MPGSLDTAAQVPDNVAMAWSGGTRPGWYRDGQPDGMERFHNGAYWEGEPRPVTKKRDIPHRGAWTTAGIVFIVGFVLVNFTAADYVIVGTVLLVLSPFILVSLVLWLLWRAGNKRTIVVQAPVITAPPTAPAGWYPDMNDPTMQRYFDGSRWTSVTHPK